MPAPTLDDIRNATETLSRLTEYLRGNPDPAEALTLTEPLLDEYTGVPIQLGDTLRALARALQDHPGRPRNPEVRLLIAELRTAAWEQTDQHALHFVLDDLRTLYAKTAPPAQGCSPCR
ncbi:hypothetical protein ABZ135_32475 [Streptomyces sp. NPDC006339]|uniref:hypothetical protein n=1 Tax=Streptomyces sp. NPDC006339 TaxID=3156755 RepID=UPI0033B8D148